MIHTIKDRDRILHAVLFNHGNNGHIVWLVGSWSRVPGTGRFIDWSAYIGAEHGMTPIDGSIRSVASWGAKVEESAARAYLGEYADRYGVAYRP